MNYPVGDFLIQIKNASLAKKREVVVRNTKLIKAVADVLKDLGYLSEVKLSSGELTVEIAYHRKEPLIDQVRLISKPGLRIYSTKDRLPRVLNNLGIAIISTSSGMMTNKEARRKGLGGEVICEIY